MWRAIVQNEDFVPMFTAARHRQIEAVEVCNIWLLGYTDERRKAIGTADSDEGWLQTLFDNGFFSITVYEE